MRKSPLFVGGNGSSSLRISIIKRISSIALTADFFNSLRLMIAVSFLVFCLLDRHIVQIDLTSLESARERLGSVNVDNFQTAVSLMYNHDEREACTPGDQIALVKVTRCA